MQNPSEEEFEVSDTGVRHRPTGERFIPIPGKPSDGSWRDGHKDKNGDYDQEAVRTMGRRLWAKFIVTTSQSG